MEKRPSPWLSKTVFSEKIEADRSSNHFIKFWEYLEASCPSGSEDITVTLPGKIQIEIGRGADQRGRGDFLHIKATGDAIKSVKAFLKDSKAGTVDLDEAPKSGRVIPRSIKPEVTTLSAQTVAENRL